MINLPVTTTDIASEIADALDARLPDNNIDHRLAAYAVERADPDNVVVTMVSGEVFTIRVLRSGTEELFTTVAEPTKPILKKYQVEGTAYFSAGFDYDIEAENEDHARAIAHAMADDDDHLCPDIQEVCIQSVQEVNE